jgi:CTP:molybdopterin cytidylyltransferase MocA
MAACVVLAAGSSARLGRPKALLRQADETALARVVRVARAGGCAPVVVVAGADARVAEEARRIGARVERNPAPEQGRTGSAKLGVLAAGSGRVLLWPVDRPCAAEATVRALLAQEAEVVRPVHAGRHGHPIVLAGSALAELLALPDDAPLHDVVRRDPARVRDVPVADAGVHVNLDTPEAAHAHGWA